MNSHLILTRASEIVAARNSTRFIKDFSGDLWRQGRYEVHLQPNTVPYVSIPIRLPKPHLDYMKEAVDKRLTKGVVKLSNTQWGNPAVVVPMP